MMLEADALVHRRRMKRRLALWRLFAIALGLGLLYAVALQFEGIGPTVGKPSQIARVSVSGIIRDDRRREELLNKIAKAKHVKALVLRINSPGGTASGGESLFEAIRGVAKRKPVVAVFSTVATSAAYMAALASDHIVARGNSITGSVGVIFQWAEVSQLMKSLGINMQEVKSGPLKANPSPFRPTDEAGLRLAEEMVGETQKWFLELVAARRSIRPDDVPGLKQGRIFSGRQALRLKLIDQIGGEAAALDWLSRERDIAPGLKVVDWKREDGSSFGIFGGSGGALARAVELLAFAVRPVEEGWSNIRSMQLDGLVSLWHPRQRP